MGRVVNARHWSLTPGIDSVPNLKGSVWAPEPVWTDAEYLAPTGVRFLDRPASRESLYRLSYPGPLLCLNYFIVVEAAMLKIPVFFVLTVLQSVCGFRSFEI